MFFITEFPSFPSLFNNLTCDMLSKSSIAVFCLSFGFLSQSSSRDNVWIAILWHYLTLLQLCRDMASSSSDGLVCDMLLQIFRPPAPFGDSSRKFNAKNSTIIEELLRDILEHNCNQPPIRTREMSQEYQKDLSLALHVCTCIKAPWGIPAGNAHIEQIYNDQTPVYIS